MAVGTLNYTPSKTIRDFMLCDAKMRAVMGPVGSGKTTGAIVELLRQSILMPVGVDGIRRSKMLIIRNTKQQLKDTTLASVLETLPVEIYKWREQEYTLRIRFNDVESDWLFRSLDTPEDVQRVLSLQVTWAWVEEAREIPVSLLSDIEGRTGRYPSQANEFRYRSGIIYTTNPPEVDSSHFKLLEGLPQEEGNDNSIINVAAFKQPSGLSPEAENINNLRPDYYEELAKGKTQQWIDVYVHGMYAQSQYGKPVYQRTFKYDKHVSNKVMKPMGNLPVIIGMDCARTPAACFMQVDFEGRIHIQYEAWALDMGAKTFIPQKLTPIIRNFYPTNPLIFIGDPAWVRQNETDDNSWFKELKAKFPKSEGHTVKPSVTNDPIARISALEAELNSFPGGDPNVLINPNCLQLKEGLRSKYRYVRRKTGNGELQDKPEKNNWSHIVEACQYGVMFASSKFYNSSDYIRVTYNPLANITTIRPADAVVGY